MTAVSITTDDLAPFAEIEDEKAEAMIADALAMAQLYAPCILDADFVYPDQAKAIIRTALLRWNEQGSGAAQSLSALGFSASFDTRQQRRGMYTGDEIEQLQKLCTSSTRARAFEVDLTPPGAGIAPQWWDAPAPGAPGDWDVPPV